MLAVARFAFVPFGGAVTIPLPDPVVAALRQRSAEAGTYRSMPEAKLALSRLPELKAVERDGCLVWFSPDLGYGAARLKWPAGPGRFSTTMVRVDLEPTGSTIVLRVRYLPVALIWIALVVNFVARRGFTHGTLLPAGMMVLLTTLMVFRERSTVNECRRAAIAELQKQILSLGEAASP
jgi:hypothetical protein